MLPSYMASLPLCVRLVRFVSNYVTDWWEKCVRRFVFLGFFANVVVHATVTDSCTIAGETPS